MYEWVIIGGGLHGSHVALRLLHEGVSRNAVRIVDPHRRLTERWNEVTTNVGMSFLRSPVVHHIGVRSDALWSFAKSSRGAALAEFLPPYQQPSYALFQQFSAAVIGSERLEELLIRARVERLSPSNEYVGIETALGETLRARRVVLALGGMEYPAWPDWADGLSARGVKVHHVFDHGFRLAEIPATRRQLVIGGGLSAAQVGLARSNICESTTILSRHPMRIHQFDADPGWLGPKFMNDFSEEVDFSKRAASITSARFRGSIPKEIVRALKRADPARLSYQIGSVARAIPDDGLCRIELSDGSALVADSIILATGFHTQRRVSVADRLHIEEGLPIAASGVPVLDDALRWHSRIHVTGPMAELVVGPTARNISGARTAASLILDAL